MVNFQQEEILKQDKLFKDFYKHFQHEYDLLQQQLASSNPTIVTDERLQLATLLLHRLLLLYFIQQQPLLTNDPGYLEHQLQSSQKNEGSGNFYRGVLRPLFLDLSSGPFLQVRVRLFKPHRLDLRYPQLQLSDDTFQRLFAFFSRYRWQIDLTRSQTSVTEPVLTPAILGYIFEQTTTRQKGTYYTRDDIADYITSRTVLPFYLEALGHQQPELITANAPCWSQLKANPERYIDDALQSQNYLPAETVQEYNQRQQRYRDLRTAIQQGKITCVDDLIHNNLNLQRFTCDLLTQVVDTETLQRCYQQLTAVTILDPTCGTGIFLLSGLRLLLPLYERCLTCDVRQRGSENMLHSENGPNSTNIQSQQPSQWRFKALITLITHNLYGVDIEQKATEICQQQLLLQLLAHIHSIDDLEDLPDPGQTIRTGNALHMTSIQTQDWNRLSEESETQAEGFNWQDAFPTVFAHHGFGVVVGNPPYVEHSSRNNALPVLQHFVTYRCANLYTCVVERSYSLLSPYGRSGMILPLAAFSTKNMQTFLTAFRTWFPVSWISFYHFRPAMLFSGGKVASIPTAIFLGKVHGQEQRFSTHLHKWTREQRPYLFSLLHYNQVTAPADPANMHYYPKIGHPGENSILHKVLAQELIRNYITRHPSHEEEQNAMYYRSAGGLYWKIFLNFPWPYHSTSNKQCYFQNGYDRDVFVALYNSSLFWWYYTITFDTFNLKDYMLFGFRFSYPNNPHIIQSLCNYSQQLMLDFQRYSQHLKRGHTNSYTIYARKSKAIIDRIDCLLAEHYGMSEEELDFILHYDLKYRLGQIPPTSY